VCALSIYSCSKSDTGLISENQLKHTIEGNNLKNGSNLQSIVTPTRKAKQYTTIYNNRPRNRTSTNLL